MTLAAGGCFDVRVAAWFWLGRLAILHRIPAHGGTSHSVSGLGTFPLFLRMAIRSLLPWLRRGDVAIESANFDIYIKQIGLEEPFRLTDSSCTRSQPGLVS